MSGEALRSRAGATRSIRYAIIGYATLLALLGPAPARAIGAASPPHLSDAHYEISVRIDPARHTMEARGIVTLASVQTVRLPAAPRFRVESLQVDGRETDPAAAASVRGRRIELRWRGTLEPLDASLDARAALTRDMPVADARGSFFPAASGWYPSVPGGLARWRVTIDLPAGQRGLVPGRLTEESERDGRYRASFDFNRPGEGITLIAGPYEVRERRILSRFGRELRVRTYFHREIGALSPAYIGSAAQHLARYEALLGEHPRGAYSIVSSPTPTGFGFPGIAYLGIEVLKLPFIRSTSLAHEILHDWWGNGVYVDYSRGNWAEGLTTFLSDYALAEDQGEPVAREMRTRWIRDFSALPPQSRVPLAAFVSRTHDASQVVGYGKAAMVFFMLREEIGEKTFRDGLRAFWERYRFRHASWGELRAEFERVSRRRLGGFFAQWIDRPDAPRPRIVSARIVDGALHLEAAQDSPPYAISMPIAIFGPEGPRRRTVRLEQESESLILDLTSRPVAVMLDPDYRRFRELAPGEAGVTLRDVTLAARVNLLLADADRPAREVAQHLALRMLEAPVVDGPPFAEPTLVIGTDSAIRELTAARPALAPPREAAGRGSARVWAVRLPGGIPVVMVSARDPESMGALLRPLPHYGERSWLVFDGPKMISRGTFPATPPQVMVR